MSAITSHDLLIFSLYVIGFIFSSFALLRKKNICNFIAGCFFLLFVIFVFPYYPIDSFMFFWAVVVGIVEVFSSFSKYWQGGRNN